jgi:hypothetical protein
MYNTTRNAQIIGIRFRQKKSAGGRLSRSGEPSYTTPTTSDVSALNLWAFVDLSLSHRVEVMLEGSELRGKISFSDYFFKKTLTDNGYEMLQQGDLIQIRMRNNSDESSWYVLGDKVDNDGIFGNQPTVEFTLLRSDTPNR